MPKTKNLKCEVFRIGHLPVTQNNDWDRLYYHIVTENKLDLTQPQKLAQERKIVQVIAHMLLWCGILKSVQ